MCDNIGESGLQPSVYQPTGTDSAEIKDVFIALGGGQCAYPVPDTGVSYSGAQDKRWSFTYQSEGNDVPTDVAIDRVAVGFAGLMPFGKVIRAYFRTGAVKYYVPDQEGLDANSFTLFGNTSPSGGAETGAGIWHVNPATGAPWLLSEITAGEFGFETDAAPQHGAGDVFQLQAAYVQIYWGWGTTPGSGAGGGSAEAPCGQSTTFSSAFTNYDSEILEVLPAHGPLVGGTRVTLRGVNFVAGSTITIGGLAATDVYFVDDEHYWFVTPAHAVGFVNIVINEPSSSTVIKRNGFQYTLFTRGEDIRRLPAVNIRTSLGAGSNSASFSVDGDSNPPRVGEQVQLIDNEVTPRRLLFAGNVQAVTQAYEGKTDQLVWRCEAVDYTWLLNRRRPFGDYVQVSASDIIKDLINRYAPGFSTDFVQTNLAKVSLFLDGSIDLTTAFSVVSRMIGGGHWYVDFRQAVHFFHTVPPIVNIPALPQVTSSTAGSTGAQTPNVGGTGGGGVGVVRLGPGSALTVAEGAHLNSGQNVEGFMTFQTTFVYDDGTESAYSPASTPYGSDGRHKYVFTGIPIGTTVGGRAVTKRRMYVIIWAPTGGGVRIPFAQINNNSTTGFTCDNFHGIGSTVAAVGTLLGHKPPVPAFVPPPSYGSTQAPTAANNTGSNIYVGQPEYRAGNITLLSWTPGNYRFRVSNIYKDMTESKMGPVSNVVNNDAERSVKITNLPVGPSIEGVPVIARRIWGATGPADTDFNSWWIVPNNTDTVIPFIYPTTGGYQSTQDPGTTGGGAPERPPTDNPVWPNDDGPYLEDFDLPDEVNDDNPLLLRNPQVSSRVENSQIRNRIFIRGAGSQTTSFVSRGATTIPVTDGWFYSVNGGQVFCEGSVITYTGVTVTSGPANLIVPGGVPEDLNLGAPVALYLMVEDRQSQADLGAIEVDKDGNPTDGVHEFTITDSRIFTVNQLYMRGYAELELYARPITTVQFSSRDPRMRPGVKVKVNLTNPPVVGEFLIQDVTIDQFHDESDEVQPRYNVTTSSVKFELDDLFFQWSGGVSNLPPPPPTAPPPPGGGGPTGPIDPRTPPTGPGPSDPPTSAFTRPVYVGNDIPSGTSRNWVNSNNLFSLVASTLVPDPAPASRLDAPTNTLANRAFSFYPTGLNQELGMLWVGPYSRGAKQPIYYLDRFLTYALLREVPLDPNNAQSYVGSTGAITDWTSSPDGSVVYFVSQDFLKSAATSFSRIMALDLSSFTISQVGQCCAQDALAITPTPLGDGNNAFTCVLCTPDGTLYAGVGTAFTGFNSFYTGVYKLVGGTWTSVLNLEATQPRGETPHALAYHDGRVYVGTGRIITGSAVGIPARIHSSADGVTWTTEVEFSSASQDVVDKIFSFGGRVYATTYQNMATDITKIWRRTVDGTAWNVVAQIDTDATNPMRGIDMISVGPGNGGSDDTLLVLCLDSGANGKIMSTRNGDDWISSAEMAGLTSNIGVLRLPAL